MGAVTAEQSKVSRRLGSGLQRPVVLGVTAAALVLLVVLPVIMLLYGSLRNASPGLPGSLTIGNYQLLSTPGFWDLVGTSLVVAVGATVLSVGFGGAIAGIVVRAGIPRASLWDGLVMLPAYMTPFIGALGWTLLLSPDIGYISKALTAIGLPTFNVYSVPGIIWVMGLYYAPLAYLYLRPSLVRMDRALEEGARVLGASPWETLKRVVIPLSLPAVVSSTLVVFVNSLGQFGVPGVLGTRSGIDVIPTALVRMVTRHPTDPNGAAVLGIALTAVTVVGLWVSNRVLRGRDFVTVGSRGALTTRSREGIWPALATGFCALYVLLAVVLPVGVMVLASFQPYLSTDVSATGFTLNNYRYVLTFPSVARSIWNSVLLGVSAAVIGSILALLIGYIVVRAKWRAGEFVETAGTAPLAIPHTVFGLALLWTWVSIPLGVYGSKWVLLLAYLGLFLPYATRATITAFRQLDPALEDASRVLGGSWILTLRRVVTPLLLPAIASGAIMILYHAIRELAASLLLYSVGSEVMSVAIWDMYGEGRYVELFALAVINLLLVVPLVAVASRLGRRTEAI